MPRSADTGLMGVATVDITPPLGIELAGYAYADRPATVIHDPLSATVLAFRQGEQAIALISLDLIAVGPDFLQAVWRFLSREVTLIACASHTHSGPAVYRFPYDERFYGIVDQGYLATTAARVATAVHTALAAATPVCIGAARGHVEGVAGNRRRPEGPTDPELGIIRFDGDDGRPRAVVLNYACHPTVLHAESRGVSADLPGAVRRRLHVDLGNIPIVWTTGAAGDQSTRYSRRAASVEEVERLGALVADEALRRLAAIPTHLLHTLKARSAPVQLPTRALPPLPQIVVDLEHARRRLRALADVDVPAAMVRAAEDAVFGNRQAARYAERGLPPLIETALCAAALNTVRLIGLPAEPFVEIGLAIKACCRQPWCWVLGYTNDMVGYVPTPGAYKEGGYEVAAAVVGPDAAMTLADAACALLNRLDDDAL